MHACALTSNAMFPGHTFDQAQFLPVILTVNMLRKQKLCLSKLLGAPFEFIEHGYRLKHPILLECGHSVCEGCAVGERPCIVTCGTCGTRSQLKPVAAPEVPRNSNTSAQDTASSSPPPAEDRVQTHTCMQAPNFCSFVSQISRLCDGCYKRLAALTCHTCDRFLCDWCWSKVHPEDSWLGHVPLSVNSAKLKTFGRCKIHRTKFVELFCQDCRLYLCLDCAHRKHNGLDHDVIPVAEKNTHLLGRLKEMQKEVIENMERMQNTILKVIALKETSEKTTNSDFCKEIAEKFVKCHGMLQSPEEILRQKMKRQEANKRIDLDNILTQLRGQIQLINILFTDIQVISDNESLIQKVSVEEYFPMLMEMKYAPCLLDALNENREENSQSAKSSCVSGTDEELMEVVKAFFSIDYPKSTIQLVNIRGQTNSDLGHEAEPERRSLAANAAVSRGQIGTRGESRDRSLGRVGHYSSLNLMRFPTTRTHSIIVEGCSYGVYLSHVKDPGEFYVVRTTARKQQQRIERLAPALVERCGHAPRKLQKDELYLVQCVLDRKWYRGRVIEVLTHRTPKEDSSVLIFNLDYGNTQVVPHSRLRVMPDLLKAEPAMALRCRLSECIPTNGKWCRQAIKMMIEMMKEGIVTMYVVRVLPDILEVDISHKSDESSVFDGEVSSLRDSMVFMEYSVSITNPHATELKKSMTAQYPHFLMPRVNSTFTGIITHVVSYTTMYMQKICIDTDYLIDLMERINTFYDLHNQKGFIYSPVIGMPCVAICTQDFLWYRAKIIDLPGHDKFTVQYVDYGNEDTLNYKLVRKIKPEFRRFPPQAFLCSLKDMIYPNERNWRLDPKTYMKKVSDEVFQVKVVSEENGPLDVHLRLDPCCSRGAKTQHPFMLFGKKPARPFFRIRPSALTGLNFDTDIPDSSDRGKVAKLMELYNNAVKSEKHKQITREPTKDSKNGPAKREVDVKIGEDLGIKIKILKVTSPSDICVSIESFLPRMQDLGRELQEFYMFNGAKKSSPWKLGNYCAVLSYLHGKWLRGFVQKINKNDMITVEYFDTMGTEEVPVSSLRILDPHFLSYPIGSIKCHLDGIPRPETDWPEQVKERLITELKKHDKIYMTKRGKIGNNSSLPIKLWVKINEETEAELETKTEAEAETKTEAEAGTKTEAEAGTKTEAEAGTKTEAELETKTEAEAETKTEAELETKAEAEAEAGTKTEAELETKTEAEAGTKTEAELETKTEGEAGTKTEAELGTKTKAEAETKIEAEAELETKTEAEAETKTEAELETKTEAEAETKIEAELGTKTKAEAGTKTEAKAETKIVGETETEIEAEAEAEIEIEVGIEAEIEIEALLETIETETDTETEAEAEAEAEAEKKPCNGKWVSLKDLIDEEGSEVSQKEYVSCDSVENPEGSLEKPQGPSNEDKEKYVLDENDFKLNTDLSPELFGNTEAHGNRDRVCDWARKKNSTVKYFVGEPTHVDSDGSIYLHDIERDGAAMELLQYSLYQFYKDTKPEPFEIWAVNDICVAKYYIDNCWYRGRILEIKDGICKVFFVDFGHVENCPGSWLRKSTTFIETPILARKYQLFGVHPISESGEWPPEVIDKIYETIIEKRCNITVVENEPNTIPKVYIRMCENDQDLAEYLVTSGLATFGPEMDNVIEDTDDTALNFFEERLQDVEIFPVAPVTQPYNSGYRPLDIPTVCFPFPIKITTVREYHICANIVDDEAIYPRLRRNIYSLQRLSDQMQVLGDQQPLLNNVKTGVACLSLYGITGNWLRAEIEVVDTRKDLVLVHYVDYGYTEYVTRDRIRTILPRWFEIPRMALNCKLYRLKKNPEIRRKIYLKELTQALSHPDLMVTIMQRCKDYYEVEIRRKNSTELVYQKLIDDGLLLPLEEDEIDYFDGFEFEDDDDEEEEEERIRGCQGNEGNQEPEEREGPDEREGPEERQGAEECNGPAECEGSEDGEGSDETEGSEDMDGSDDDDEEEEEDENEEIDFEVEEVEEEEEEGEAEGVEEEEEEEWEEEEEEMEEVDEVEEAEEAENENEQQVVEEEFIEIQVD